MTHACSGIAYGFHEFEHQESSNRAWPATLPPPNRPVPRAGRHARQRRGLCRRRAERMSPSDRTCGPAAGRGEQFGVQAHPDGVTAVRGAAASCDQVALRLDLDLRRYADRDLPRRGGQDSEQKVTMRGTRVGLNAGPRSSLMLQKTAERVLLKPHLPSQVCILLLAGPGVRADLALDLLGGGRSFRLPTPRPATDPEDRAFTCSGCGRPTQKGSPLPRARVRWRPRVEQCLHQADATARPRRR